MDQEKQTQCRPKIYIDKRALTIYGENLKKSGVDNVYNSDIGLYVGR